MPQPAPVATSREALRARGERAIGSAAIRISLRPASIRRKIVFNSLGYPGDVGLETFAVTKRTNNSGAAGTLLHLVFFGLVAVVTVISFGVASFSFLSNSRELLVSSGIGEAAIEFAYPHAAVVPYTKGDAAPAAAVADPPSSVGANLPLPSAVQNLTSSYIQPEGPGSGSNFEPPSEQEESPTIQEARHAPPTQRASIDKPLSEAQQRAPVSTPLAQVVSASPNESPSPSAAAPIPGEEGDQLFRAFQILYSQPPMLDQGAIASHQTTTVQPMQSGRPDGHPVSSKAALQYRMRKECGPIHDPQLRHNCISTFGSLQSPHVSAGAKIPQQRPSIPVGPE
jgi:hypothetical protein